MRRISGLAVIAAALGAQAPAPPNATSWYIILAQDGATIGHSAQEVVPGPDGREIVENREIRLQEQDHPPARIIERNTVRQDRAGRTVAISEYWQNGANWARTEARIDAASAQIVRQTNSGRHEATVALPANVRFDSGGGLLAGWDPARTPRLEFENFNLGAMIVEHVVIEAAPGSAPDAEGGFTALRTRYDGGELRSVGRLRLDGRRRVTEIVQPMFGTSTTIRPTTARRRSGRTRPIGRSPMRWCARRSGSRTTPRAAISATASPSTRA